MMTDKRGKWCRILLKALYIQITFLVLHYLYDLFPNPVTRIISGTSEAVFQHMKIVFYSYALVSLIEFLAYRKRISDPVNYGFARIGASVFYCWIMFIFFFAPPAYYGQYERIISEIISANIILYLSSICAIILERQFESSPLSKEFKIMVVALGVILTSLFVIYTYKYPWFDVFAIPPGWE
jgi:hypothetical protein